MSLPRGSAYENLARHVRQLRDTQETATIRCDGSRVIVAGDGDGFSVPIAIGDYAEWAKFRAAGDWEAADAVLRAVVEAADAKTRGTA